MEKDTIGIYQVGDSIVIELEEEGHNGYSGIVFVQSNYNHMGLTWRFDGLNGPKCGTHYEGYLAESAVNFGGYYTSDNRGDDLPSWAPPAKTADAINDAYWGDVDTVNGNYPGVKELDCLPDWCVSLKDGLV